jgi:photosystem II stability/assembly factor-like uncharacterized protein
VGWYSGTGKCARAPYSDSTSLNSCILFLSMRSLRLSAAALAALVFLGAGCGGSSSSSTTGGVWLSENKGLSWTAMHTLPLASGVGSIGSVDVISFAVDPSDESALYVGTKTSGLLLSLDGGATWSRPEDDTVSTGAILDIAVAENDVCTYYVLKADVLMKTTSCGREFSQVYVEGRTKEALTTLALDWYHPTTLYLGTTAGEVYRSSDAGKTWTALYTLSDSVSALEVSNADSRYIIMGSERSGLYRSEDAGITWISLEDSLEDLDNADRVYALAQSADGSQVVASTKYGLLVSDDKGLTWKGLSLLTAAGDVTISALAVGQDDGDVMMYGTPTALYFTSDGGSTWSTHELPSSRAASVLRFMDDGSVWLGVQTLED